MIGFHMLRHRKGRARYYRVDLAYNLFGEYSMLREWGLRDTRGTSGTRQVTWFSNLRDACLAAEACQTRAARRGYATLAID